jgi:polyhydroxyalkanoate synthase subunit PhaE
MADEKKRPETDPMSFFADWMKSAVDFWGSMAASHPGPGERAEREDAEGPPADPAWKAHKTWDSSARVFGTLLSSLAEPDGMEAALKNAGMVPDFVMDMAQQTLDAWMTFNSEWMDRASRIGQQTKTYSFENIDQEIFKAFREIYEKEFQKYLQVPPLGLTRFQQERFNRYLDKFTLYQTALNEFLQMFYIPIEKSLLAMQEKFEEMADKGELHDDLQSHYRTWIKVLEGHYMTLLKSPEYTQGMTDAIDALVQYKKAREEMLNDIIGQFPIPTQREMDELYRDIYEMKKQIKSLTKQMEASAGAPLNAKGGGT